MTKTLTRNGAAAIVSTLNELGVDTVFGHPGGAVLPLYDALHDGPIRHVLCRHEQGAAHAADGYARATGRVGVCIATSGPGATNLVTGLATAHMDSVPVLALTGQVARGLIGSDGFQEADIIGITLPVCKHSYQVRDARDLARVVREGFLIAGSGRPGPVLIDVPKDVQLAAAPPDPPAPVRAPRGYRLPPAPRAEAVAAAAALCHNARRPLLLCGGGAAGATRELAALQGRLRCPVACTLMGLGAFPAGHPAYLGMVGMHGAPVANHATAQADVLVVAGARLDDRVTGDPGRFAAGARLVHVDIDAAELGKIKTADAPILADCAAGLSALLAALGPAPAAGPAWWPRVPGDQGPAAGYPEEDAGAGLSGPAAVRALRAACPEPALIVADVGQHQMWAGQHFPVSQPRRFLTSGGLGTMGYALPAAIGAKLGRPEMNVLCLTGDGGLQMTLQELAVVGCLGLPLVLAVLNNGHLGMVRQWQELFFGERYAASRLWNPDFCRLGEAYGIASTRVAGAAELHAAAAAAFASGRPALLDVCVTPAENTWPIVPAGAAVHEMIVGPGA